MREINHVAQLDRSLASMIGQPPSPSHPIEPARAAQARPDTEARDWLRLQTMVHALLRRAATSKDAAASAAIAATKDRAGAATRTTSPPQEAHHD
jgi:hypothetical protein